MASTSKSRGVENPVADDMALIGETRNELHYKPLPRKGPSNNYGAENHAGPDPNQLRVDCGYGMEGE